MKSPKILTKRSIIQFKKLFNDSDTIVKMTSREAFLAANHGVKATETGLYLQGRRRSEEKVIPADLIRVGFTCSKKLGNAVKRNKAKRRLTHVARHCLPKNGLPGWDYVLVGRKDETAIIPFSDLIKSFNNAIEKIHLKREKINE